MEVGKLLFPTEAEREEQDKIQRQFFTAAREGNTKLLKSVVGWDCNISQHDHQEMSKPDYFVF